MGDQFDSLRLNFLLNYSVYICQHSWNMFWKSEIFPFAGYCFFDSSQEFCNLKQCL